MKAISRSLFLTLSLFTLLLLSGTHATANPTTWTFSGFVKNVTINSSLGYTEPESAQLFQDVPSGSPFSGEIMFDPDPLSSFFPKMSVQFVNNWLFNANFFFNIGNTNDPASGNFFYAQTNNDGQLFKTDGSIKIGYDNINANVGVTLPFNIYESSNIPSGNGNLTIFAANPSITVEVDGDITSFQATVAPEGDALYLVAAGLFPIGLCLLRRRSTKRVIR